MAKIAIITYSTYGHIIGLAKVIQESIIEQGSTADIFQVAETLPQEVLTAIHAPEKDSSIPIVKPDDLTKYDAILFGIPTRFANIPSQLSAFVDSLGGLWASGALFQKPAGVFVSTGSPGGGQEVTIRNFLSFLAHHGMIYVPLGYGPAFGDLTSFDEAHGGSPWGAGMYAGADGSRSMNETEKRIAKIQGETFVKAVNKFVPLSSSTETSSSGEDEKKTAATNTARKEQAKPDATTKPESNDGFCGLKCVIM